MNCKQKKQEKKKNIQKKNTLQELHYFLSFKIIDIIS